MVSSHSGLPESVELRMLAEKQVVCVKKREKQLSAIYAVLDKMTSAEKNRMIVEVIKHYKGERKTNEDTH